MTDLSLAAAPKRPFPLLYPLIALGIILGWTSGFIGIRYLNEAASVPLLLFWRCFLSAVLLLPFALLIGPRMYLRDILVQAGFGFLMVFVYLGGFALAIEQRVPTGLVALISDLVPLAIAVIAHFYLRETLTPTQWLGTAIAILGVLIVSAESLSFGSAPIWAYALTLLAMLVFALASIMRKTAWAQRMPLHQCLFVHSMVGALLFAGAALYTDGTLMPPLTLQFALGMAWLVLFAALFTYWLYYRALQIFPAAKVSAAVYLSPPTTMLTAWAMFDEPLTTTILIGMAVTLIGVWLTSRN